MIFRNFMFIPVNTIFKIFAISFQLRYKASDCFLYFTQNTNRGNGNPENERATERERKFEL